MGRRPTTVIRTISLFLVAGSLSADEAGELRVLNEAQQTTPPARLLYDHLRRQAHEALDKRLQEYEAAKTAGDVAAYQAKRHEFFLRQLGGFPARIPLNARIVGELSGDAYRIEKVIFESQPNHHVTALMYLPDTPPPYPCVVVACGHSRTAKAADYNQRFGIIMARHGMAALCYDPIGQGERSQILDDQGMPKHRSTTAEHFQIGVGSILLGTNTARYRIWDGMRAIDYVTSRNDVNAQRIGFTGCSGGGTLTSYVMALDDRVYCAAPACYLTTFRRLIDTIGPQDAEQNIFGQIAFGMDHPDYVLMRAPKPTLISATTGDYFDIQGVWANYRQAKRFYSRLGYAERVDLVEGDGAHGVRMNNLVAIMRWMRRWLLDKDDAAVETEIAVHALDALRCTPSGQVLDLPDELSVFDLNARWHQRLAKRRAEYWRKAVPDEIRRQIRQLAGIREALQVPHRHAREMGSVDRGEYRIDKLLLEAEDSVPLPALLFTPPEATGNAYLYLDGKGNHIAARRDGLIERLLDQGHIVLAVDLPGIGETRGERSDGPLGAWKDFYMAYLLGKSLVGIRAEAAMQSAWLLKSLHRRLPVGEGAQQSRTKRSVHLIATGEASIPALHAAATSDLFSAVYLPDGIPKWADIVSKSETNNQLVGTVHGALRFYDLDDLARLHGQVSSEQPHADAPPKVNVSNIRRVFHNGEHNAFTDLVRFQDRFYLTFRSCPDGHGVHPTASIIILASDDATEWRGVHRFRVEKRDTRDPHFLIFKDKMFVYTGTWYSGETSLAREDYDLNKHLGYAAWTRDGTNWHSPVMLEGTFGHYIWRANKLGEKAYLCGRRKKHFAIAPRGEGRMVESLMLESDDGLVWRKRAAFQEIQGDETAFQFEPDGSVIAIGRRGGSHAQLLRSKPPYREWERKDLGRYIGGPLLVRWGDRYVVGGRKSIGREGPKTSLYWLMNDKLHEFAELPSGGDTSYPGFVELSPTHAIVSWYSSHEQDARGRTITAVYMADLTIAE